jgi:hypothetical protein
VLRDEGSQHLLLAAEFRAPPSPFLAASASPSSSVAPAASSTWPGK